MRGRGPGGLRDLGVYLRGRINSRLGRVLSARRGPHGIIPRPVDEVIRGPADPAALIALLEGRSNGHREIATARYLAARGAPVVSHRFETFEGRGENFAVDLGTGDRVLVLVAHHDAVPGSPGANDNAASVAILLHLLERLVVPPRLRVRLLFTAAEELGYLGARAYVRQESLSNVVGVLSLELCGIGDTIALWDVEADTPFLAACCRALEGQGLRRDETYHQVGRIPVFGSDHRAFSAAGIPAYGLTVVPVEHADALRQFVFSPVRSVLMNLVRRPPPFDTYHTARDSAATVDAAALTRVVDALQAIVTELG